MAQEMVEGIVAVIGDKVILKSEVEQQYLQLRASDVLTATLSVKLCKNQCFKSYLVITQRLIAWL